MSILPKAVQEIGQLNFEGNIIPHTWYQHLTYDNGKPNVNAIIILSDILYWYRPSIIRDERTGHILEYRKKFAADKLQRNYTQLSEQFGFTKKQARDAVNFLVEKKLITKELRKIPTDKGILSQVMYLEPVTENIKLINTPAQVTTGDVQVTTDDAQVTTDIPTSHTYTETPTETPTERENTPDFLTDVFEKQNTVNESTGPNPEDQWIVHRDDFMRAYAVFLGQTILNFAQKQDITAYIAKYPQDTLDVFENLLTECRHNWTGRGSCPWARILEVREAGGNWKQWKVKNYPQNGGDKGPIKEQEPILDLDGNPTGGYYS